VHMTSLECNADDDGLSGDELESTAGDVDTDTESMSDGIYNLLVYNTVQFSVTIYSAHILWPKQSHELIGLMNQKHFQLMQELPRYHESV